MSTSRVTALIGTVVLAAVLAACSDPQPPAGDTAGPDAAGPAAASVTLNAPLAHLHGLHSAAAGRLLAGTHTGLFAIDPVTGATSRVGDSDDDFMGLAGTSGTDNLVSSGHPGQSSDAPNPLGLRASSDGGRTWATRSLSGETDFHVLATDGGTLIGSSGQGLQISNDGGATWTPGADVQVAALTIIPTAVWAVTPDGVSHSTDGGRSFAAIPDAPQLTLISGTDRGLWGVDIGGYAWFSPDGTAWQKDDYVGPVEALTSAPDGSGFAATATTLYKLDRPASR
jgi:hypothetical protein